MTKQHLLASQSGFLMSLKDTDCYLNHKHFFISPKILLDPEIFCNIVCAFQLLNSNEKGFV